MASAKKSAATVSLAVVCSRLFGLVREQVFAAMFGAGKLLDACNAAFQIPNLLRDLFAEGALSTSFTTTFTKLWEKEGAAAAWALARLVISTVILVLGALCLAGIYFSEEIVAATNYGFTTVPGKFALTVELTRILFPFILFVSLAAVVMGMLNARHIFGLPASASTAFNIVSVVCGVALAYWLDPQPDWRNPHFSEKALYGVCFGVLLGGMAQLVVQLPALWKLGFRYSWKLDFSNPHLRTVMKLMLPSIIAGAAVQVNVLVNGIFASYIDGGRSWLNCAFRLMQFPIGVFGVAIATVTLPTVSRLHALKDSSAFGKTVEEALRFAFFLTVPASLGLAILAKPIIFLIYQHGRFDAADTQQTAIALQAFSLGLAGYAAIKVLVPCFYALDRPRTPLRVSLFGIGLNLALNFALVYGLDMGHVGLALTTALIAIVNFGQLSYYLGRHVNCGTVTSWRQYFIRLTIASGCCASVALAGFFAMEWYWLGAFWPTLLACGATIFLATTVYFTVAHALSMEETGELAAYLKRKFGKC